MLHDCICKYIKLLCDQNVGFYASAEVVHKNA